MKKGKFFGVLMLFIISNAYSQSKTTKQEKIDFFQKQLYLISDQYRENEDEEKDIVHSNLLDKRLTKAFNQVVLSSSDLVDNASAFGYSQNKEKTTISVNTNFRLSNYGKDQWYIKAGINSNGSGSLFNLYSDNEWRNSVGGSFGIIYKFSGSGYTNEKSTKLDYNKKVREVFIRDSIMNQTLEMDLNSYQNIRRKYISIKSELSSSNRGRYNVKKDKKNRKELVDYYSKLSKHERFFKKIEKFIKYKGAGFNKDSELEFNNYDNNENIENDKLINYLLATLWSDDKSGQRALENIITDVTIEFDKKNIKNTGYSFWWLDGDVVLNNNTFNFSEKADNVDPSVLANFNALDAEKTGINKLSTVVSLNLNYASSFKYKGAWYLQGGLSFSSGSFLNSNLINGTAKISEIDQNRLFIIQDENDRMIGNFASINESLQYGTMNLYGAYFFGKKKIFGLNISYNHRYRVKVPENTFYKNNYSLLFGPIFRKPQKDSDTGLTFGIDAGFDNAIYSNGDSDNFVARIRVGIPFKLFNIEK